MPDVSKLRLNGTSYDIKDDNARKHLVALQDDVDVALSNIIDSVETSLSEAEAATKAALSAESAARAKAIADEASSRSAMDSSLQAQINSLSSLPSGSTTGDAELIDARVSYDGITHPNAGTAIRTQASHLRGITNYSGLMKRTYFINRSNGVVINTNGVMTTSSGSFCTEYIPVNGIVNISIGKAYSITGGYNIAWFDKNRNFLEGKAFATLGAAANYEVLYPPSGAAYIVISNQNGGYSASDYVDSPIELDSIIDSQLEKTYITSYEDGYYLNTSGSNTAHSGWFISDPIPVYAFYHIYFLNATSLKANGLNVAFYSQNLMQPFSTSFISGYSFVDGNNDMWGVVPDGATHMVISQPISKHNAANYVETLPHPYTKLKLNTAAAIYNFFRNPTPYTEIDIAPGIYDLYAAGFASDIASDFIYNPYMFNVKINGNGATLKCNCPKAVAEEHVNGANACSIINELGNVEIRDLTLDASNIRYAIHSECQLAKVAYNTFHIYSNIIATNATTATSITTNGNAVGIGASLGQRFSFDNCTFTSIDSKPAVYFHGRLHNFAGIVFRNCVFNNGTAIGVAISQYTGNGVAIPVHFINCILGRINCVKQSGGENYGYQFVVTAINSYVSTLYAGSGVTFIEDPRRINTLTGVIDTSYSS